jgi:4-hydroxy-4-methyl-2-oxoglutarate aldolase
MIGDPPIVTLRRGFTRPNAAQLAAFAGVPTGFMVDAQNGRGAVDYRIKPLWPEVSFAAPAVTVDCGPRDNLGLFIAIEVARPGDVIMLATGAYEGSSVLGDHVAAMAKNKGVVAIVTDGLVRDVEGLIQVGLPVYCRGVSPNSPYKSGPCAVGTAVTLGGVAVASGDLVVGDRDGVVVVPQARIDEVAAALQAVHAKEHEMGAAIEAGLTTPDWVHELLRSSRTRLLD